MFHPDLIRHPDSCPALVLNADYTPLSYYPLSLWPWQTAVKAMFLDRVDVVASYEREVRSATVALKLPSVIALKAFVEAVAIPGVHALQPVPARPFRLPILRARPRPDLRSCRAARAGRPHDLGECRHRLRAMQSEEGRADAAPGADAAASGADPADELAAAGAWQVVPAQLLAPDVAGLAVLGHRTGGVARTQAAPAGCETRKPGRRAPAPDRRRGFAAALMLHRARASVMLGR